MFFASIVSPDGIARRVFPTASAGLTYLASIFPGEINIAEAHNLACGPGYLAQICGLTVTLARYNA